MGHDVVDDGAVHMRDRNLSAGDFRSTGKNAEVPSAGEFLLTPNIDSHDKEA